MTDTLKPAVAAPEEPKRRTMRPKRSIEQTVEATGLPIFLVLLIVVFSLNPTIGSVFFSKANLHNILANQSVTALVALGMVVPLVAGYFDLSVAAIAGLSSVAVASLVGTHGQPIWVGVVVGIAISTFAGACNGFLVAVVRLNPFVSTFGVYVFLGGVLQWYTGGKTIFQGIPPSFGLWGTTNRLGIPNAFWLLLVVSVVCWYWLTQTPIGRKLTAIGSNETAARLIGFGVDRLVFSTFVVSGFLAGIAGILLTSSVGAADATSASSFLFPALAAVFLGQTSIRPGQYNVWGTILGVFLVAVAIDGLTLLGAQSWVTSVFNGLALILAVSVSTFTGRLRERRSRAALLDNATKEAG